jgi:simple sugar transport system permease protein
VFAGKLGARLAGTALAIVLAFAVSAILILLVGANPIAAYTAMLQGSVGGVAALTTTGVRMTPLLLAGLGVAISFRAGVFNIGAEGQLYLGAIGATIVALMPLGVPAWLHVLLALLAGIAGGAVWAAIPGYLLAYRGISEVVLTLMLNYVGIYLASYLVDTESGPLGERGASYSQSAQIQMAARLPTLVGGTSLHLGLVIGLVLAVALWAMIRWTPFGFRMRMIGANPIAARYAGVAVGRQIVAVMALSGGLAGLAGAVEVIGLRYRLYENFSPGYGYDAIAVALLANSNPLGVIASSAFFGALQAGANRMQQTVNIETSLVFIIQALTVIFVIAAPTIGRYTFRRRGGVTAVPGQRGEAAHAG